MYVLKMSDTQPRDKFANLLKSTEAIRIGQFFLAISCDDSKADLLQFIAIGQES